MKVLFISIVIAMTLAACAGTTTTPCQPYDTACETNHGGG
jgi:hypothetical protein